MWERNSENMLQYLQGFLLSVSQDVSQNSGDNFSKKHIVLTGISCLALLYTDGNWGSDSLHIFT